MPEKKPVIAGDVFGRLTLVAPCGSDKHRRQLWVARCECGTERPFAITNILKRKNPSCGECPRPTHCQDCGVPNVHARGRCQVCYRHWIDVQHRECGELCSVAGCANGVLAGGMCEMHYARNLRNGGPGPAAKLRAYRKSEYGDVCAVNWCEREPIIKGMCDMHYKRAYLTGDAGEAEPRRIARPNGSVVVVRVGRGRGRVVRMVKLPLHPNARNGWIYEPRLAVSMLFNRPLNEREYVISIDGNPLNVHFSNLYVKERGLRRFVNCADCGTVMAVPMTSIRATRPTRCMACHKANHPSRKVSFAEVLEMRILRDQWGCKLSELAAEFGLAMQTVSRIVRYEERINH